MSKATATIFIADDHEIVRFGIRTLLGKAKPEWEICGEAENANDALEKIKKLKPDIVITDITMPGTSGLEAARRIRKQSLCPSILMFTMHDFGGLEAEVRGAGAQGYVLKSQAARDLVSAIESLLQGGTFFGAPSGLGAQREPKPKPHGILRQALA